MIHPDEFSTCKKEEQMSPIKRILIGSGIMAALILFVSSCVV